MAKPGVAFGLPPRGSASGDMAAADMAAPPPGPAGADRLRSQRPKLDSSGMRRPIRKSQHPRIINGHAAHRYCLRPDFQGVIGQIATWAAVQIGRQSRDLRASIAAPPSRTAAMPKPRTVFVCSACGADAPRWQGQCPSCAEWNTLSAFNAARKPRAGPSGALAADVAGGADRPGQRRRWPPAKYRLRVSSTACWAGAWLRGR